MKQVRVSGWNSHMTGSHLPKCIGKLILFFQISVISSAGEAPLKLFFLSYQILSSLPVFKDAAFLPRSETNLYQAWNLTDFRLRGLAEDADRVFYHYTSVKILTISPFKFLFGLSPTICNYQLTAALKGNPFERKHMWRPKPTQSSINFLGKPFVLPPGMKFI